METLITINDNENVPEDYALRKVVRAVILDETEKRVLFFGSAFVGGGVEEGETDEQALMREAMEEIGATIEIIRPIGEAVAYRDFLKKKYVSHAYACKIIGDLGTPTSTDPEEQKTEISWIPVSEAIQKLEMEIQSLESGNTVPYQDDLTQRRVHHRKMSLAFLKELLS